MSKFSKKITIVFIILLFLFPVTQAQPKLEYTLSMEKPFNHYFQVEMNIRSLNGDSIDIKMPVWAPGSYKVRDFSKNVINFRVSDFEGNDLSSKKINKNTWRIYTDNSKDIKINYEVYAFTLSVRASFLDASHGYVNGTSVFMFIDEMKSLPSTLKINPYKEWENISTGLQKVNAEKNKFYAENYDILADSPIEIGNHEVYHFKAAGVDHEIAIYGGGNYEIDSLIKDFSNIVEAETKVFGENPNEHYVFIMHNSDTRGGGLEHLNSTTLHFKRFSYHPESSYNRNLSTVSHEYFHLWNVKRIRPIQLGPFNYNKENYTHLLWVMEGVTDYYADLILQRVGIYDDHKFLQILANTISALKNRPGRDVQSAAEASFDAWIKYYQPNENSYNTTISYYQKGFVLGALLDLEIINAADGEKSLDDVMRYVYYEYYKNKNRGITEKEWQKAVEKIAGKNLDYFFDNYVYNTIEIDYQEYFDYAGIEMINASSNSEPFLGISSEMQNGKLIVEAVYDSTAAYFGKLNARDEIISVNGFRVDEQILDDIISMSNQGDSLDFTVSRKGIIKHLNVILQPDERVDYTLLRIAEPSDEQNVVYNKWLSKE